VGFTLYGRVGEQYPAAKLVDAVEREEVDVAVLWGPFAGYFAHKNPDVLSMVPVSKSSTAPYVPLAFDISLGVHPNNHALLERLNEALARRKAEIQQVLADYGVPVLRP
jgi:mxaJ protein